MIRSKKIKVLVVDDSLVFREVLSRGISSDSEIEVVAKAVDPFDARDKILKFRPDVMTCDIEMPKMNGIEFIKRLLPQYSLPVIVVSTVSNAVFDALNAGAVDFVIKPDVQSVKGVETLIDELIYKIKISSTSKVIKLREENQKVETILKKDSIISNKIIAIGASTGGTEAIFNTLKSLPNNVPGIVIVQHIPPVFSKMFAERLNNFTPFNVREAITGDVVERGSVLIAPGDKHMRIKKFGDKYKVECFNGDKVNGHCPSVDVLFESVAKEAGKNAVGVILTGMGYDGAKGLLTMKNNGARTIGQNENSSVVYGMPKVAFNIGAVEKQTNLENIPSLIYSMLKE
ncbi:protein-glutamate methylesterase/protein-glutamine glutaminase [Candidatus Clostridium stratigraminis]|uniref:Protein-glutamate methylesterase/protein-glutamine glutaminase n=1 Tax=Candidatus Clostridium stratigraminis TaxID=3381661 RepID=A0ABW8T683_9CLOT